MYSVRIRNKIMIAHSLGKAIFGPASKMHGATYVVDAVFSSETLDENNIVIDIGLAHEILKEVLGELDYQNLDELPIFQGKITTTEFLAKFIHDRVRDQIKDFDGIVEIVLGESHEAWASYKGENEHL